MFSLPPERFRFHSWCFISLLFYCGCCARHGCPVLAADAGARWCQQFRQRSPLAMLTSAATLPEAPLACCCCCFFKCDEAVVKEGSFRELACPAPAPALSLALPEGLRLLHVVVAPVRAFAREEAASAEPGFSLKLKRLFSWRGCREEAEKAAGQRWPAYSESAVAAHCRFFISQFSRYFRLHYFHTHFSHFLFDIFSHSWWVFSSAFRLTFLKGFSSIFLLSDIFDCIFLFLFEIFSFLGLMKYSFLYWYISGYYFRQNRYRFFQLRLRALHFYQSHLSRLFFARYVSAFEVADVRLAGRPLYYWGCRAASQKIAGSWSGFRFRWRRCQIF